MFLVTKCEEDMKVYKLTKSQVQEAEDLISLLTQVADVSVELRKKGVI